MTCRELVTCLLRAKNQTAEVRVTDQYGSFNVGVLNVEGGGIKKRSQPNDEDDIIITLEPYPKL